MDPFDQALTNFKATLPAAEQQQFSIASEEAVRRELDDLQKRQETRRTLRNLNRIEPFIKALAQLSEVIGIFVQAKPDILAFIWACVSPFAVKTSCG